MIYMDNISLQVNPLYHLISTGSLQNELKKLNDYDLALLINIAESEQMERDFQ